MLIADHAAVIAADRLKTVSEIEYSACFFLLHCKRQLLSSCDIPVYKIYYILMNIEILLLQLE